MDLKDSVAVRMIALTFVSVAIYTGLGIAVLFTAHPGTLQFIGGLALAPIVGLPMVMILMAGIFDEPKLSIKSVNEIFQVGTIVSALVLVGLTSMAMITIGAFWLIVPSTFGGMVIMRVAGDYFVKQLLAQIEYLSL